LDWEFRNGGIELAVGDRFLRRAGYRRYDDDYFAGHSGVAQASTHQGHCIVVSVERLDVGMRSDDRGRRIECGQTIPVTGLACNEFEFAALIDALLEALMRARAFGEPA